MCPIDRTPIDLNNTFPDNAVKLQINGLKIRCPMEGCNWVGEMSDKMDHLSKCKHLRVSCDLCWQLVLKSNFEEHVKECPQRKVCPVYIVMCMSPCQCDHVILCCRWRAAIVARSYLLLPWNYTMIHAWSFL